jgi:hypothetical protein
LMVAVETRTFEFGIFRMVGMTRKGLICVVLVQAMFFSIPAWIFGIITAQAVISILSTILYHFTKVSVDPILSFSSFFYGTLFGILCPMVSCIYPIRVALSKNLRDSLDTRRAKAKAVVISIERNDSSSTFNISMVGLGVVLVTFGVLLYYFFPKSIIDDNITLLFNIFLVVLVGLMLGLVMLSFNVQPIIESFLGLFILRLCFKRIESKCMYPIVRKNLTMHRARNRKTAMTYAVRFQILFFCFFQ